MSHITKEYFEGHECCPMFDELATYLGIDLASWEFADGTEDELDDLEFLTVIYTPCHDKVQDKGFTLYGVFVYEGGEWQVQQIGTNQDD